ncbi:cation transporter [bacterium DOLZORAL124_38_8]|nr:MAG: cation transporter [bacterium DOLZORAL124_38_8]
MHHTHHGHHHHSSTKNIKTAFFLNISFTIIELIGGLMTNSMAIMSDALHDLGDSFSLGLAWFLEKQSNKKPTPTFSYGYKRLSLLGALINALILLVGSIIILISALPRLIHPETVDTKGMIFLSILGIIINGAAVFKTSHGENMNEKVISLHLLEDVLGWVAVFIVSIVMSFTKIDILDPILSILITLYILYGVVKNLKQTILLFLQTTPQNISLQNIQAIIKQEKPVLGVHDLHIWSLDGEKNVLSGHVVVPEKTNKTQIKKLKQQLKTRLEQQGIQHNTIEIEYEEELCHEKH